jgi:ActR/RegA family two-component response regulator
MVVPVTRVLFVDDEQTILVTFTAILQQKGFDVTTAASVPEALKLINTERFEVLISDLNIGEPGDGFTVVSAMRRVQPEAAAFILTGYPDFESALLAIRNQVDDYFTKPADVNVMVEAIRQRLSSRQPINARAPLRRVSEILRANTTRISHDWLLAVKRDRDLARLPLSDNDRTDHIPWMLAELVGRLERNGEDTSSETMKAAEQHGRKRCKQGYSGSEIVRETRILQHRITSTVQANLLGVNLSNLVVDLVEIGESLASTLEISIRAYQQESSILRRR